MVLVASWMQRLDLPEEPMPTQTLVEIVGFDRVLIEHHSGINQYSDCCIGVKVKKGQIIVNGGHLRLMQMTADQVIISGCIQSIQLERTGK